MADRLYNRIEITGPVEGRFAEILTPAAIDFVAKLDNAFAGRRRELLDARRVRREELQSGEKPLDFLPETRQIRDDQSWHVAPPAPGLEDRRVEITGPTDRKMTVNALNSGAKVWLADFEDATSPTWHNVIDGQVNLYDAIRRNIDFTTTVSNAASAGKSTSAVGKRYTIGLAPGREAHPHRRPPGVGEPGRLRPVLLPQRAPAARARRRPVLLPAEAGKPPRSAPLERRFPAGTTGARRPARHDPRHSADRDDHRGLRNGRDPVRAARACVRAERRSLGLHLQPDQELRRARRRLRAAGPRAGDHDRAVHARVHRAAGAHLPQAGRARDRWHGRVHPQP